ncbi:MAG: NAD(P)/FAD-dependent oxidoreductase, partial [Acidaminococcales bacterium]|nr:NAD(P)/FAD-dependent oxidoreductase [Acidaminococcales bacterium]
MIYDVIIAGAGPAGLMAGITAAASGRSALILEHMAEAGRKLLICGKGRCNITNTCDINEMIKNIPGNGVFLHSCLQAFDNRKLIDFFHGHGLCTKAERGGRVFPASDKAADVRDVLLKVFAGYGGRIFLGSKVCGLVVENRRITGVRLRDNTFIAGRGVIVSTGGASYPSTGSDGSGFKLAESCGHTIVTPRPSLVPLETDSPYAKRLQGLSLRNVTAALVANGLKGKKEFGELIFTHFGLSGPIILTVSNLARNYLDKGARVELSIDLKPALEEQILDARLQRDFAKHSRKKMGNALAELTPGALAPVLLQEAGIDADKFANQLTKKERRDLLNAFKDLRFAVTNTRPRAEAIVTAGGVSTKEIDPATMRSKIVDSLYFAGEVLDIDGYTGGFNLQAAFSTGYAAGKSAGANKH